jgi:hypothetical protein
MLGEVMVGAAVEVVMVLLGLVVAVVMVQSEERPMERGLVKVAARLKVNS